MLNEVYAPTTVAELAWSRQKIVALSTFVRSIRSGAQSPRLLLLYGPPGCGKVESLKVLLDEEPPPPAASTRSKAAAAVGEAEATESAPAASPTTVSVFHTCEATPTAYVQYLQHVISLCSGQLAGSALSLATRSTPTLKTVDAAPHASDAVARHAHIIKFYGEPASHVLHRCTVAFLRQYEALCSRALDEEGRQQQRRFFGAPSKATTLLDHLRRNLIFLVHTTHDSHNDKVDLASAIPAVLLHSSAVELFHCTPVTEINLKKRLRHVLEAEARRRAANVAALQRREGGSDAMDVTDVDALFSDVPASPGTSPASRRGIGGRGGGGTLKAPKGKKKTKATAAASPPPPNIAEVLDPVALDAIAAGSQGDIRQALLQVQWAALVPPEMTQIGTAVAAAAAAPRSASPLDAAATSPVRREADAIWARLQHRREIAQSVTGGGAGSEASGNADCIARCTAPQAGIASNAPAAESSVSPSHPQQQQQQNAIEVEEDDEDVVLLLSSSSSSDSDEDPSPSLSEQPKTRKRSRSPQAVVLDMLSLLDAQMRGAPPATAARTRSRDTAPRRGTNTDDAEAAAAALSSPTSTPPPLELRSVLPTTRDEYLGLSHATGRLLSQRYSVDEVLEILNVPPRKMLDYLANNQVRYFSDAQLPQYAACANSASEADALRSAEFSGGYGSGISAAALRERRLLADRTTAGESVGNVARLLDVIALQAFHRTYRVVQTEVHAPPGFTPQEPPPFLRAAYPRLRDVPGQGSGSSYANAAAQGGPSSLDATGLSETEWTEQFLLRLDCAAAAATDSAPPSSASGRPRLPAALLPSGASALRIRLDEVDILREGLPDLLHRCGCTESAVTDYYAVAPYIVLNGLVTASSVATENAASPLSSQLSATPAGASPSERSTPGIAASSLSVVKPRRTVFKLAALATPPPIKLQVAHHAVVLRRPCTSLQLKILQRGRDKAVATLREEYFALVATENMVEEGTMGENGVVEERPWMPDGEDIEED